MDKKVIGLSIALGITPVSYAKGVYSGDVVGRDLHMKLLG